MSIDTACVKLTVTFDTSLSPWIAVERATQVRKKECPRKEGICTQVVSERVPRCNTKTLAHLEANFRACEGPRAGGCLC